MLLGFTLLLLMAGDPASRPIEPPQVKLSCREEIWSRLLLSRRRLCLTEPEWADHDRKNDEAHRRSVYELMGNTDCLNGGMCTSD
jgi:hypothetical protein